MNEMNEELLDLLAERALGNLSPGEETRLAELLEQAGLKDSEDMELAVAAAMNAFAADDRPTQHGPVPERLHQKLHADADRVFGDGGHAGTVTGIESARSRMAHESPPRRPAQRWLGRSGWAVAAVLAVVTVLALQPESGPRPFEPAAAREALMAQARTEVVEWTASDIPAYGHVRGDVVWNDEKQKGFLRLTGMPANDPSISQYQLWIVDPDRDERPVDGGVFDVPPGSEEVIIPITAKLDVSDPDAFAITREQPGGVVVSDGPLLIVAAS